MNGHALTNVRRVTLQLRAGVTGFEVETDLTSTEPLAISSATLSQLKVGPEHLVALRVRDAGMEPMFFEDDWVVIDTSDTTRRSREIYAVNWNGEACVQQILERGGQWYLNYTNPDFGPVNVRSGQLNIVGRVIYQPGRVVTGRL